MQMRKRNLLIVVMVVFALGLLPACEILEDCGSCTLITEDADGNVTEGTPLPFCGDAYKEKQDEPPVTVGGITTYWDCN